MGEVPDWTSTDTSMLLIVDTLAHRYHCLPSQVLAQATTFDLRVNEVRSLYDRKQHEEQARAAGAKTPVTERRTPQLTQDQMNQMIAQAQKRKKRQ